MRSTTHFLLTLPPLLLPFTSSSLTTIPQANNTFRTGLQTSYLVDSSRLDPFAPNPQPRAVAISAFYPIARFHHPCNLTAAPYAPPTTAAFVDQEYGPLGVPNGTLANLRLSTCRGGTASAKQHPILLFSPGHGGSRLIYNVLAQAVASAGYIVVTIDHPYDADIVEFPDGRIILAANTTDDETDMFVDTRAKDAIFVLDQLNIPAKAAEMMPLERGATLNVSRVGFFGHSLGGATAAAAMLNDSRIAGGIDLDGDVYGPVVEEGLDRPFLLFGHEGTNRTSDLTWAAFWPNLRGERIGLELGGSLHDTFTDFPYLADFLGFRSQLKPVGPAALLGTIDGRRAVEVVSDYVVKFMDEVLKGRRVTGLREPDERFPEVTIFS